MAAFGLAICIYKCLQSRMHVQRVSREHLRFLSSVSVIAMPGIIRVGWIEADAMETIANKLPRNEPPAKPKFSQVAEFQCPLCQEFRYRACWNYDSYKVKQKVIAKPWCMNLASHHPKKAKKLMSATGNRWLYEDGKCVFWDEVSESESDST